MELVYKQADSRVELEQILDLQDKNLPGCLSPNEKAAEGFVTVCHSLETLEHMNNVCGHIIALDGDILAGYALCMHPDFADRIPVLKPMFSQIHTVLPKTRRYLVMGQICIDKAYRQKGIFRELYSNMKHFSKDDFDYIITEVDTKNTRSLGAHKAVGFRKLCAYSSGGQDWVVIFLPTTRTGASEMDISLI